MPLWEFLHSTAWVLRQPFIGPISVRVLCAIGIACMPCAASQNTVLINLNSVTLQYQTTKKPICWHVLQFARATRVRVPPLAFWANERINHQSQGFQVEQGFSDQLAHACHGLAQASPAKKAKKVTSFSCLREASFTVL